MRLLVDSRFRNEDFVNAIMEQPVLSYLSSAYLPVRHVGFGLQSLLKQDFKVSLHGCQQVRDFSMQHVVPKTWSYSPQRGYIHWLSGVATIKIYICCHRL